MTDPNNRSRHVPKAIRDEVFAREGGRCTYVGRNGRRCRSNWDLEIDHVLPFARGGDNTPDNLRLLCRAHNHLEGERHFGERKTGPASPGAR